MLNLCSLFHLLFFCLAWFGILLLFQRRSTYFLKVNKLQRTSFFRLHPFFMWKTGFFFQLLTFTTSQSSPRRLPRTCDNWHDIVHSMMFCRLWLKSLSPIHSQFQMSNKCDVIWPQKLRFVFFPFNFNKNLHLHFSSFGEKYTTQHFKKTKKMVKWVLTNLKTAVAVLNVLCLSVSSAMCACLQFDLYHVVFKAEPAGMRAVCTCNTIVPVNEKHTSPRGKAQRCL